MANCVYYYKGHKFDSEIKLDDFLLANGDKLYSKYGDLVFQSLENAETCDKLNNITNGPIKKLQDKYKEAKNKAVYIDGEPLYNFNPPYIGVTSFLKELTNKDGELLTPAFREFNYWNERIKDWKDINKGFNEDEENLFGKSVQITEAITDEELLKFLENYEKLTKKQEPVPEPTNLVLKLIKLMKDKWQFQGKSGTAIHDVLKKLFTKIEKEGPNKGKLLLDLDEDYLINMIFNSKGTPKYDSKYLNNEHLKDIITYAKKLKSELTNKFGENLSFFPEFQIASKLSHEVPGKGDTVLGIIDLLVVDNDGNAHVIDYKVSPKDTFNSAKERGFWYLLGLYNRLLRNNNIRTDSKTPKVMVAPIKLDKFRKENDTFVFDTINARDADCLTDITANATLGRVSENLDEFIPIQHSVNLAPKDIIDNVTKFDAESFPEISTSKSWDDEEIQKLISRNGGFEYNESKQEYNLKLENYTTKPFTAKSETELFQKVKEYFTVDLPKKRLETMESVLIALRKGIKEETSEIELPKVGLIDVENGASTQWFKNILGKYCNRKYSIIENPAYKHYGIILIQDNSTGQIDVIKITSDNLEFKHKFNNSNNRQLITGAHVKDSIQAKKPGDLSLAALNGNIHLMETMAILNCTPELTNSTNARIGQILVANPRLLLGMAASNEELIYNFNELTSHIEDYKNNLKSLKFASKLDLARNKLKQIISAGEETNWEDKLFKLYKSYTSLLTSLDDAISEADKRHILTQLENLRKELEKYHKIDIASSTDIYNEDANIARSLYDKVMLAIAEVLGITFRQQTKDNKAWLDSMEIGKNGVQSLMLDNPGNLNNDTLNLLTKLVTEAYLNVREDILREMPKIRKMVDDLKKDVNFNKVLEMTGGNETNIFMNMFDTSVTDDIVFKNPWSSNFSGSNAEKTFLKYVLTTINNNRFANMPESEVESMKNSGDRKYFRVPLAVGDLSSRSAVLGGLYNGLKSKLKRINPKDWWQDALKKLTGVFSDPESSKDDGTLFEMNNMFERGEKNVEERIETINKYGKEYFEHNIETILLKHMFAYSTLHHINNVMPMAKAAMIHLISLGHLTNKKYTNATNYVTDYIKNKIKGESLVDKNMRNFNAVVGQIKLAASLLILGFSPIQYGYLMILSLWTDLRLIYLNLNSETPFTFENFKFACSLVYKDLFKLGGKPTLCSLINEFYAINDMDMNVYSDKIKSDRYGIYNFSNIAFHCASRPDFYSRMSILIALMKQDGTWEAHSMKDGQLIYDWTKDSRFDLYAKALKDPSLKNDPKYNELKGLYLAMAELLEREHAMNKDGSKFKIGDALPKAYTNQQMEGYKSIADNIYGYYAHEKKAMIHAMTLGSLWMLMRTFWSGKKNQYLGGPGIKLQGKYVQQYEIIKDTEGNEIKEYWYLKEENGKMVPTKENTGIPLIKWEGLWQEGILLTMCKIMNDAQENGYKTTWDDLWSDPDNVLERANIKQIIYDMTMFIMVGPMLAGVLQNWDDDLEKEAKDSKTVDDGAVAAAAHMAMKMVSSSFGDFNFIESIGSPLIHWQPFSFAYWGRKYEDFTKVAMGEKSFYDALIRMSGATSNTKIFWDNLVQS